MFPKPFKNMIFVCTFAVFLWPLWVHGAYEMSACVDCHREGSQKSVLHIRVEAYENSVHGNEITCTDCHTNIVDEGHMALNNSERVDCNTCHEQENRHGLSASGVKTRPDCYSCHTRHAIFPSKNPASSVNEKNLTHTCGTCHSAETGHGGWLEWLPTVQIRTHGKQDFGCDFDESDCLGCHQGQGAHGEKGLLNDRNCWKCHASTQKGSGVVGRIHAVYTEQTKTFHVVSAVIYGVVCVLMGWGGCRFLMRRFSRKGGRK